MNKTRIGQRIREERKKHHYTLEAFSTKVGIGKVYLGEIERGLKMPSLDLFGRIVNAFGDISADYLLRDYVMPGTVYAVNDISDKIKDLSPFQIRMISDVIDSMIVNFKEEAGAEADGDE